MKPMPIKFGVGISALEKNPKYEDMGLKCEQVGIYFNYHFNSKNWKWVEEIKNDHQYVIDGFSPNLNKELHIGHLRNLVVATSLSRLFPKAKMVAMLGAAVGQTSWAQDQLERWYDFANYKPEIYFDNKLPEFIDVVDGKGEQLRCKVWQGPKGDIIVTRSDGRHTYAHHDLSFAKLVNPTHYVTGAEQKEHFESLGFGHKHLAMGLVLGEDGKKVSSRHGGMMTAQEAYQDVINIVTNYDTEKQKTSSAKELAWNILAWNFLKTTRSKNTAFVPEQWVKAESPGMYISYTYARIGSALGDAIGDESQITESDLKLLGMASYLNYYVNRSVELMDCSPIANYSLELAKLLTSFYHAEKIKDGRPGFQFAIKIAYDALGQCLNYLGMKQITSV